MNNAHNLTDSRTPKIYATCVYLFGVVVLFKKLSFLYCEISRIMHGVGEQIAKYYFTAAPFCTHYVGDVNYCSLITVTFLLGRHELILRDLPSNIIRYSR